MEHSLSVHAYVHCKVVHGKFHTQTSPAFYLLAQQILISSIWYVHAYQSFIFKKLYFYGFLL